LTDRLGANLDGVLAEYAVFNEEAVVLLPSHLSFEEAATLPCAAVTAWVALTGHRRVTAGDTVLIQGSGGVSTVDDEMAIEQTLGNGDAGSIRYKSRPQIGGTSELRPRRAPLELRQLRREGHEWYPPRVGARSGSSPSCRCAGVANFQAG
jgi:hypothetical protein